MKKKGLPGTDKFSVRSRKKEAGVDPSDSFVQQSFQTNSGTNPTRLSEADILQIRKTLQNTDVPNIVESGWLSPKTPYRNSPKIHVSHLDSPKSTTPSRLRGSHNPLSAGFADDVSYAKKIIKVRSPYDQSPFNQSSYDQNCAMLNIDSRMNANSLHEESLRAEHKLETSELKHIPLSFETVQIPPEIRAKIAYAKKEFERELSKKRAASLSALKDAMKVGSKAYLEDLTENLGNLTLTEKIGLPISIEFEEKRKSLLSAVLGALVEEAASTFYQSDSEFHDKKEDSGHSIPIDNSIRHSLLNLTEQVKAHRLGLLEREIELESAARVREIDGHVRFREKYWENKIYCEVKKISDDKRRSYIETRRREVMASIDSLHQALRESANTSLNSSRALAEETMSNFQGRLRELSAVSTDEIHKVLLFLEQCQQQGPTISSSSPARARASARATSSGPAGAPLEPSANSSDEIFDLLSTLQQLSLVTGLAKYKLEIFHSTMK